MDANPPLTRSADVTIQRIGQEVILYDRQFGRAHVINSAAARIWELCDGRTTLDEVARCFAATYHMTLSAVYDDVVNIIRAFRDLHLLS